MNKRQLWAFAWSMYRLSDRQPLCARKTPAWIIEAVKRAESDLPRWYKDRILLKKSRSGFEWHPLSQLNCRCVVKPMTIHQLSKD